MKPHNLELMSIFIPLSNIKNGQLPTLPLNVAVPSALSGFTSLFGMGRGSSTADIIALD